MQHNFAALYNIINQSSSYQKDEGLNVTIGAVQFTGLDNPSLITWQHKTHNYFASIENQQRFTFDNKSVTVSTNRNLITVMYHYTTSNKISSYKIDLNNYTTTETYFLTSTMILDVKEHHITISRKGKIFLSYCFIPPSENYYRFFDDEDDDSYTLIELYDDVKYTNVSGENFSISSRKLEYTLDLRPTSTISTKSFTSKAKPEESFKYSLAVSKGIKSTRSSFVKVDYLFQNNEINEINLELIGETKKNFFVVKLDELKHIVKIILNESYNLPHQCKSFTLTERLLNNNKYYFFNNSNNTDLNQKLFFTSINDCINKISKDFSRYYENAKAR